MSSPYLSCRPLKSTFQFLVPGKFQVATNAPSISIIVVNSLVVSAFLIRILDSIILYSLIVYFHTFLPPVLPARSIVVEPFFFSPFAPTISAVFHPILDTIAVIIKSVLDPLFVVVYASLDPLFVLIPISICLYNFGQ
jgi:hypothetical protein